MDRSRHRRLELTCGGAWPSNRCWRVYGIRLIATGVRTRAEWDRSRKRMESTDTTRTIGTQIRFRSVSTPTGSLRCLCNDQYGSPGSSGVPVGHLFNASATHSASGVIGHIVFRLTPRSRTTCRTGTLLPNVRFRMLDHCVMSRHWIAAPLASLDLPCTSAS